FHLSRKTTVTTDNDGQPTYGGSHLFFVRGAWEALGHVPISNKNRIAANQARLYDHAKSDFRCYIVFLRHYYVGQRSRPPQPTARPRPKSRSGGMDGCATYMQPGTTARRRCEHK